MAIQIPSAGLVVCWDCRRCGHTGGVARTTVPIIDRSWTEDMFRHLFDALRLKLVKVHMRSGSCIPTPEDFIVRRATEEEAKLVGLV